jgi:mannose-1-phosphate guanylyltransferase
MFVWKTSTILQVIKQHLPEIDQILSEITLACDQGKPTQQVVTRLFHAMPDVSIDVVLIVPKVFAVDAIISWHFEFIHHLIPGT